MRKEILRLHRSGYSIKNIAKKLKCPISAVKYYLVPHNKAHPYTKKIWDFCRTNKNKIISTKQIKDYLGEKPVCYLTGKKINIYLPSTYSFDHIIPLAAGGSNKLGNLGVCSMNANKAKADMLHKDFIKMCKIIVRYHNGK